MGLFASRETGLRWLGGLEVVWVVWWWFGANMEGQRNKNAFKFILQVFILSQKHILGVKKVVWCGLDVVWGGLEVVWGGLGWFGVFPRNPGRFAPDPVRPLDVSPQRRFAPGRFAPGRFVPLVVSPLVDSPKEEISTYLPQAEISTYFVEINVNS